MSSYGRHVGFWTRFLWSCAGADAGILERCPHSDHVKYAGIGGTVLTTGVLATLSGSYAFYTVFGPKAASALAERPIDSRAAMLAVAFGALYGLIIFNIDRFIVSSSGKGDGTDAITFKEFLSATPRIVMAIMIGICMSKPLEVKILENEVRRMLSMEQEEFLREKDAETEKYFSPKLQEATDKRKELEDRYEKRRRELRDSYERVNKDMDDLKAEAEGRSGTGHAGEGKAYHAKSVALQARREKWESDKKEFDDGEGHRLLEEVDSIKKELESLEQERTHKREKDKEATAALDGLGLRIHLAHKFSPTVSWTLTFLLLAFEVGPIFFKMMLERGAYDFIKENGKEIAIARRGILHRRRRTTADGDEKVGEEVEDVFLEADALTAEFVRRHETQKLLAERAHDAYRRKMLPEIDADVSRFVRADSEDPGQ
jgi:hypothetical protein